MAAARPETSSATTDGAGKRAGALSCRHAKASQARPVQQSTTAPAAIHALDFQSENSSRKDAETRRLFIVASLSPGLDAERKAPSGVQVRRPDSTRVPAVRVAGIDRAQLKNVMIFGRARHNRSQPRKVISARPQRLTWPALCSSAPPVPSTRSANWFFMCQANQTRPANTTAASASSSTRSSMKVQIAAA